MRSLSGNKPSFKANNSLRQALQVNPVFKNITNVDYELSNAINEDAFRYDPDGSGLKSTQELNIDYSAFENHTFFNSARSKVDVSFDNIVNYFPYENNRADVELFLDRLTGFEKYVYDEFPKNVGYLNFSNSYITVRDGKSLNFPELEQENFGIPVLDVSTDPFSFEFYLFLPEQVNDNQVVFQRISNVAGITFGISQSLTTTDATGIFLISSGNNDSYVVASGSLEKGKFNHVCAQTIINNGSKQAAIYVNTKLAYTSSDTQDFGQLIFNGQSLFIGSGSTHTSIDYEFTPRETFSGSIDEFRFFKTQIKDSTIKKFYQREIYSGSNNLSLYFRFNEPSGSYDGNNVVLDYSGNKLHSYITNYNSTLRMTQSLAHPVVYENTELSPILFASHDDVSRLNLSLLIDAASYDNDNPNFILKLIPPHYFRFGATAEGFTTIDQNLGKKYTAKSIPGTGILPKPQEMLAFLLIYAKYFDELKLFIDYFSTINMVELNDEQSGINKLLPYISRYFGINVPDMFTNTTPDQFFYGQGLEDNYSYSKSTLKNVRYQIWRRIYANLGDLIRSKGTRSVIRSAFLTTGIVPENFFNIREFGGPAVLNLKNLRQQSQTTSLLADMSGSLVGLPGSLDAQGFFNNMPHFYSSYLSGSRIEPGIPEIEGSWVPSGDVIVSNSINDGLMTSGSFALETTVKFKPSITHKNDQSLIRLQTTGSETGLINSQACILNVVYNHIEPSGSGEVHLLVRSSDEISAPKLDLQINDVNLFNGEKWFISAGRIRGDLTQSLSSSYYLRCGYLQDETDFVFFTTSSYFSETTAGNPNNDMFQTISNDYNSSGSFIVIGSQSLDTSTSLFLNANSSDVVTHFDGLFGQVRFWSKALTETESLEHLRNFESRGVEDPRFNFNFDTESSGTFQRLRVDVTVDQGTTGSNSSGEILLFDFSQNNLHLSGSGFEINKLILKNELFQVNRISPNIDLLQTDNKVRVRSLQDYSMTDDIAAPAPVYDLGPEYAINDDNRLSIEYSAFKALNEDIIGLLGDTQFLDDALGQTALIYDEIYPDLEKLSKVYFERLLDPVDMRRCLELFKWFDSSLTTLIEQLLPRKTKFLGINYVIESHLLERNRYRYPIDKMYLLDERSQKDMFLYLSAFNTVLKRY